MISLTLTPKATERLNKLSCEAANKGLYYLRLNVIGGGCSGLQYKMEYVDSVADSDHTLSCDLTHIAMDEKTAMLTFGMTIDYDDGLNGKGFEYINPNAKRACGCGESFSV